MRWALAIAASALVAACSAGNGTDTGRTPLSVPAKTTESARSTAARPTTTPTTRPPVAAAPDAGADLAGASCVDYAHRSAVRMGAAGVDGFGCLTAAQAPPGIGIRLSC